MQRLWGCRLEIGLQSTYEDVARDTNRGHTVASVGDCFRMAKNAGFKVPLSSSTPIHLLPNLLLLYLLHMLLGLPYMYSTQEHCRTLRIAFCFSHMCGRFPDSQHLQTKQYVSQSSLKA